MKPDRCSDRFIPSRAGARWHIDFNLISENGSNQNSCNNSDSQNQQHQQQPSSHPHSNPDSHVHQANQQVRKRKDANENGKGISC